MPFRRLALALLLCTTALPAAATPHNVVIFVSDGLRYESINPKLDFLRPADVDAFVSVQKRGVDFANSHSVYATLTTANASAIATGHYLGDTGDFANTIEGPPGGDTRAMLESDATLLTMNAAFSGNYLNETSLLALARQHGMSVAVVGKEGPAAIQDVTALGDEAALRSGAAIVIDDQTAIDPNTGKQTGGPTLAPDIIAAMVKNKLFQAPPVSIMAGTTDANLAAEQTREAFFANAMAKVVLPALKKRHKPFAVLLWSPDPDWSQHLSAGPARTAFPGINSAAATRGIQNANAALRGVLAALHTLKLQNSTDVFLTADHGFSTVTKRVFENGRPTGVELNSGFLAEAIAAELKLPSKKGVIGDPGDPDAIVAANGGSDLIYLPRENGRRARAAQIARFLLAQPYVAAVFANDDIVSNAAPQDFAGALGLSDINYMGAAATPKPALVVSFASFVVPECSATGKSDNLCAAEIADTPLGTGQGMHGTLSRADTRNFMAAIGPDFAKNCTDQLPVSNADITPTLASVLGLDFDAVAKGTLKGRVIREALGPCAKTVRPDEQIAHPIAQRADGDNAILQYQTYDGRRYFDAAGVPGRTEGLSAH